MDCCFLYLSTGFIEASQQVWCPAFSVETNDCLQDLWVLPPVQRLEVVGRHDEELLLTRNVGKEYDLLCVARLEQRPHGLLKKIKTWKKNNVTLPQFSLYCVLTCCTTLGSIRQAHCSVTLGLLPACVYFLVAR